MNLITLQLQINNTTYLLGDPLTVGRKTSRTNQSNCFNLPLFDSTSFSNDEFTGDISLGGSCNVNVLTFSPHNITHIETENHIADKESVDVSDLPTSNLHGICYLIDLSNSYYEKLTGDHIRQVLNRINLPISFIAVKTQSSTLSEDTDFTGKKFTFISTDFIEVINEFSTTYNKVVGLITDLPSIDSEEDSNLSSHKLFFENQVKHRFVMELCYFDKLNAGYYYVITTPSKIRTDAINSNAMFFPIITKNS